MGRKRQKGKIRGNQRNQASELKGLPSKFLKAELHARALVNSGKIEEAIFFLREQCQRENSAPILQSILGFLEIQSGLSQIGLERSKNAAERAPNNFRVLTNHGSVLLTQGYASEAVHYFERAIKKNPKLKETYLKLANAYMVGELFDQAKLLLQNYNEKHPKDVNGLILLVETLNRGQNFDEAKRVCFQLIKQDPSKEISHFIFVDLLISEGEIKTAENYIQKLKISHPNIYNKRLRLTQAKILYMRKNYDLSISFLQEMLLAQPGSQTVAKQWRSLMLAAGYFKKGWQAFFEEPSRLAKIKELPHRVWQGEKSDTRTLLIRGAEGIGEQLMYSQLLPLAQ
ncbi:MAG: tetratricopeptide repeat protein, partial [Pseudomonadota bacterium]|nr:tetratricopeptide repeat protein [Pseudomonadota bacterium]